LHLAQHWRTSVLQIIFAIDCNLQKADE